GEWDLQWGNHVEVGAGVAYYRSLVMTTYPSRAHTGPTLSLRIMPVTGVVRVFPVGNPRTVQPYIGIGVSALRWRYSESGQFLDASRGFFNDQFTATGTGAGPVFLGGIRLPVSGSE